MKKKLLVCMALMAAMLLCAAVAFGEMDIKPDQVIEYGQIDQITSVDGRTVIGDPVVTKEPTCTEKGIVQFEVTPQAETSLFLTAYIKELGHDWSSKRPNAGDNWGEVVQQPSCTETGRAIDICLREGCDAKNPDEYRIIETTPHTFDDEHYTVVKEATCSSNGYGIHTCIYCEHQKAADVKSWKETKTTSIVIPMKDHEWTEWRVDEPSVCGAYGKAHRACINCGTTQWLDTVHRSVLDHGDTLSIDEVIPQPNAKWDEEKSKLEKEFKNATNLNAALNVFDDVVDYEPVMDWLVDCYTRKVTLSCKYCHGKVHHDVTYTMVYPLTVAHVWTLSANPEETIPATCTTDGTNYYICEKDADHDHNPSTKYGKDPAFYTEKVPALGHDWLDWEVVEEYKKDGKEYQLMIRECARCHNTENQVVEKGEDPAPVPPTPMKNGLVMDEDGKWRYYENGEFDKKTAIVPFEGGEFWVLDGVLPTNANGLTICPDGKAYFLSQGQILRVSQFAEYQGEWFIIKNGMLDESANGLYDYDGGTFVFAAGKLRKDVNGLWLNPKDNKWYFLANGQVQKVSQVASYNGEFFVVKDGVLDTNYNGTIEYDGKTFNVVNGQLYDEVWP